jgi:ribosomal protein S4
LKKTVSIQHPYYNLKKDKQMKIKLKQTSDENIHGFCTRCKNYTNILGELNICKSCEKEYEKRQIKESSKKYIKAGTRDHIGL